MKSKKFAYNAVMSFDVPRVAARLRSEYFVDLHGLLKPGGRTEVTQVMQSWQARGLRSFLLVAKGEPLTSLETLWGALRADSGGDLVLLFNGTGWAAKGWGLSPEAVESALREAEPSLKEYFGKGLAKAIEELAKVSPSRLKAEEHAKAQQEVLGTAGVGAVSVAATIAVGTAGFVFYRKRKIAREARRALDEAVSGAERAYAELVVTAEDLPPKEGAALQLRASAIETELSRLAETARKDPAKMSDPLVLGKIRQFESELLELHSQNLQKGRRQNVSVEDHGEPPERGDEANEGAHRVGALPLRGGD